MIDSPLIVANPTPNPSKYMLRPGFHTTKKSGATFHLHLRDGRSVRIAFTDGSRTGRPDYQFLGAEALREMAELFNAFADILDMGQN
jgi:hypothetical protein